jgi:hypothetical protein
VWFPKGRIATGAVLSSDGQLYIAAKAERCTVCVEAETDFDSETSSFCVQEFEDYRAPAGICEQHPQNKRAFVRERMLTLAQLQRESNSLAGGENLTVIQFQLGSIPVRGELHAPTLRSAASRTSKIGSTLAIVFGLALSRTGTSNPVIWAATVVFAASQFPVVMAGTHARTQAFHQHENDCNCLLGCKILGEDNGPCSDKNDENARAFENALANVPDDDGATCDLLKCMAYCGGPKEDKTGMFGRPEELLCSSVAKQIGCSMDCSGSHRTAVTPLYCLIAFLSVASLSLWL